MPQIPVVSIEWTLPPSTLPIAIVIPETCSAIAAGMDQLGLVVIGHIEITFPSTPIDEGEIDSDYDEDNQLYAAVNNKNQYAPVRIPITSNGKIMLLKIPHFENLIATNMVARALHAELRDRVSQWVLLAPCDLSQSVPVAYLGATEMKPLASNIAAIPVLEPPHCVLGIGAAVLAHAHQPALLLAVYAEGVAGHERVDGDALVTTAYVLQSLFERKDREKYIANVTKRIRGSYGGNGHYL